MNDNAPLWARLHKHTPLQWLKWASGPGQFISSFLFGKAFYMLKLSTKIKFWNVRCSSLDHQLVSKGKISARRPRAHDDQTLILLFVCLCNALIPTDESAGGGEVSMSSSRAICRRMWDIWLHLCVFARARVATERAWLGRNSIIFFVRFVDYTRTFHTEPVALKRVEAWWQR